MRCVHDNPIKSPFAKSNYLRYRIRFIAGAILPTGVHHHLRDCLPASSQSAELDSTKPGDLCSSYETSNRKRSQPGPQALSSLAFRERVALSQVLGSLFNKELSLAV